MKISTLLYTVIQGFRNIIRNKWYSLASIATISACLFLLGIFYAIVANFQNIVYAAEEGVSVSAHIYEDVSDERVKEIGEIIARRTEVSNVVFVTDEEAWESMRSYVGETWDSFLENPLAGFRSYTIYLSDVSMESALVTYLESMPEIYKVNSLAAVTSILSGVNLLISYVTIGIIAILLAVSIFLIRNTVTIGISVRKEEINIMKYIGATDFFVRAPFVLESMLIGFIGASLPLVLLHSIYNYVLQYVFNQFNMLSQFLHFLSVEDIFRFLTPVSMVVGVGIGFLGSITTVRKHLRV